MVQQLIKSQKKWVSASAWERLNNGVIFSIINDHYPIIPGVYYCFYHRSPPYVPFLRCPTWNATFAASRPRREGVRRWRCEAWRESWGGRIWFNGGLRIPSGKLTLTSLRMIPTMTFIHFLTGKASGILSDISSGILSGILSGISSGICSGISSGISSGILSGKSSGILSGISFGILSDILSDISSDIFSGILSGISSDIFLAFYLAYLLTFFLAYLLTFFLTFFLAFYLAYLLTFYLTSFLPVEVRQCPLRSGRRGWGPAVPTQIWSSRLRSGSAHSDLELAVEVRQCPLWPGSRGWGPAVPTGIWTARRRWRRRRRRRRTALIKSNNPHLAGGEKSMENHHFPWVNPLFLWPFSIDIC